MIGRHLLEMFLALHFTNHIHFTILVFRTLSVSLATNGQFPYRWALHLVFETSYSAIHRINYYPLETKLQTSSSCSSSSSSALSPLSPSPSTGLCHHSPAGCRNYWIRPFNEYFIAIYTKTNYSVVSLSWRCFMDNEISYIKNIR